MVRWAVYNKQTSRGVTTFKVCCREAVYILAAPALTLLTNQSDRLEYVASDNRGCPVMTKRYAIIMNHHSGDWL